MSSHSNVSTIPAGSQPESDAAIADRVRRVFGDHPIEPLGDYLLEGRHAETVAASAMDDVQMISEILAVTNTKSDELADRTVPRLAFLQTRILHVAQAVQSCEFDRRQEGGRDE